MKKILFGVVLSFIAVAAMAASGRALNGSALTYNLNGSDQFIGSLSGSAGVAEIKVSDTANIMIWCADAGYFINGRAGTTNGDGGSIAARMVPCAAGEKYPIGLLQPGVPYISISNMDALFFERK